MNRSLLRFQFGLVLFVTTAAPSALWAQVSSAGENFLETVQNATVLKQGPPNLNGSWRGDDWGNIELQFQPASGRDGNHCSGTYTDTFSGKPGKIELTWSPDTQRFEGTWSEGEDRSGKLAIRRLSGGKVIRGSWTTDAKSKIHPGKPDHSDLEWLRTNEVTASEKPAASASKGVENSSPKDREVKIFMLAHARAADLATMLAPIYPDIKLVADQRTNSILAFSNDKERLMELEAILLKLDEQVTPRPQVAMQLDPGPKTTAIDFTFSSTLDQLKTAVDEHDMKAKLLAEQIRQQSGKLGDKHPEVVKLRQQLEHAVQAGLEVRFKAEQMQVEQLQERLSKLRTQLEVRKAASRKIIDRRIRDLLEPEPLRWNPESASTSTQPGTKPDDNPMPDGVAGKDIPAARDSSLPESVTSLTQVKFIEPAGSQLLIEQNRIRLDLPARYNFERSAKGARLYAIRLSLKSTSETFPATLEIHPGNSRVATFLANNSVPLRVTDEDLDQLRSGNAVTKVVYLPPSPEDLAADSLETIVSTRVDPEIDVVAEARRRGSVVAVIRWNSSEVTADTVEGDPKVDFIWRELGAQFAATTDPKLLPKHYRGGLLITRVDRAKPNQFQVGDVLLGIHKWETLSLDNVLFILRQTEVRPTRVGQVRSIRTYTARNGQVRIQSIAFDGAKPQGTDRGTAATTLSLDQWIVMLHKDADPARAIDVIHAVGQFGKGDDAERAAATLLAASDSIDPANQGVVTRELLRAPQSIDPASLIGPVTETLRNGTSRMKWFALSSITDLKDFTASELFPELVKLVFQMAECDDARLRIVARNLLVETMGITGLNPAEISTEERRQMVQRLKEASPQDRVWQLIYKGLEDSNVEVALTSATWLTEPRDPADAKTSAKVLDILTNICRGKLGEETADRYQRGRALYQLTLLGPKAASAVPMVMDLLKSDDPDLKPLENQSGGVKGYSFTRNRIIIFLGQIGPAAKDVLPELESMLAAAEKQQREDDRLRIKGPNANERPIDLPILNRMIDQISGKVPVGARPSPFN